MNTQKPKHSSWIIFDWNGTLLNDLSHNLSIINKMRALYNLVPLSQESYQTHFCFPLEKFYEDTGFGKEVISFEDATQLFIDFYHDGLEKVQLFEYLESTLRQVKSLGYKTAILSAYNHERLVEMVKDRGLNSYFDEVVGIEGDGASSKGKQFEKLVLRNKIDCESSYMIGDTDHDFEVAKSQGVNSILIPNGHQNESCWKNLNYTLVKHISDIPEFLKNL